MKEKFYLTTAIPYCSGKPHIGNTYEVILTDAVARYKRQRGYDVFFLTGTDEHGLKIENAAKEKGVTPKEYTDKVCAQLKEIWKLVGASYDKFIRTTDDYHGEAVAKIFQKLYEQDDIYKGVYEGWYCVPDESFFTDTQLVDGKCPDCGRPVEKAKEEAYFLRLSKYADRLLRHIEDNPGFIEPESRKKEMINNFIKPGLQDLCVSRTSFNWGIKVPSDPKHVIYVWIDALSNYITALGYSVDKKGELYEKYWPCDVHIIGKDIVRFHTIYWPIILMALGEPLPKKIYGHGWLNFGVDKMSKSKGNVMYADDLVGYFGVDGVRYYTLAEMPFSSDGSITYENIIARYNTDLANNLGNLVNRTIAMNKKYFDKVVQKPLGDEGMDSQLKNTVKAAAESVITNMDSYHVSDALDSIFEMFGRANKYIDENTPWILAKDESLKGRLGTVLYNLLETIRIGAVLLAPFLPDTSDKILSQLGTDCIGTEFGGLVSGSKTNEANVLFARIDEAEIMAKIESDKAEVKLIADGSFVGTKDTESNIGNKPVSAVEQKNTDVSDSFSGVEKVKAENAEDSTSYQELSPEITFDDFLKPDLRVAQVLECEVMPKSKKLLKLQLDLGFEKRQVLSGISKFYTPQDLIGKKVVVVANLKPRKMGDEVSYGMILASGEEDVKVIFAPDDAKNGDRVH